MANPFAREDDGLTGAAAAAMRVAKTFQPGQNGTKRLAMEFGGRLSSALRASAAAQRER